MRSEQSCCPPRAQEGLSCLRRHLSWAPSEPQALAVKSEGGSSSGGEKLPQGHGGGRTLEREPVHEARSGGEAGRGGGAGE